MKKILFIATVLSLSFVSCKKDYTCVCSTSFFGATISITSEAKSSKKGAEAWCNSLESGTETVDGQPNATLPVNCELK